MLFPNDKGNNSQKAQQPVLPSDKNTFKKVGAQSPRGLNSPASQKDLAAKKNVLKTSAAVKTMQVKLPPSLR